MPLPSLYNARPGAPTPVAWSTRLSFFHSHAAFPSPIDLPPLHRDVLAALSDAITRDGAPVPTAAIVPAVAARGPQTAVCETSQVAAILQELRLLRMIEPTELPEPTASADPAWTFTSAWRARLDEVASIVDPVTWWSRARGAR